MIVGAGTRRRQRTAAFPSDDATADLAEQQQITGFHARLARDLLAVEHGSRGIGQRHDQGLAILRDQLAMVLCDTGEFEPHRAVHA